MEYSTPVCTYSLFYVIVSVLYEQIIEIYYQSQKPQIQ